MKKTILTITLILAFYFVLIPILLIFTFISVGVGILILDNKKPYTIEKERILTNCQDNSKIVEVSYISGDELDYTTYYQNNNHKIGLNSSLSFLAEANPKKGFDGNSKNSMSRIGGYSFLDYMQKEKGTIISPRKIEESKEKLKETVDYIQKTNKKYNRYTEQGSKVNHPYMQIFGETKATYIDSTKISQKEFNEIVECLKKIKDEKNIPSVLFYTNTDKIYHDPDTKDIFETFKCQNPINDLRLALNGKVFFKRIGNWQPFNLGYFDEQANFIRDKEVDKEFEIKKNDKPNYTGYTVDDLGFEQAYQESQTLKLLFNQNQEPINDYLNTCKNTEGKTIFEIFKE